MSKPIILHVTSGLQVGGAERFLVGLLAEFIKHPQNQFEHRVVYFRSGPCLVELDKLGIKADCVAGLWHTYDPVSLLKLGKLIWQLRPKYLHSQLWMANLYTRLLGKVLRIPVICSLHANYNRGYQNSDDQFKLWLDRWTMPWVAKVVAVSPEIAQKARLDFPRLQSDQIVQISNGIKLPITRKVFTREQVADLSCRNFQRKLLVIGHVGRFVPVKNQALLLQALGRLRDLERPFRAILVGYGPLEGALRQQLQDLNLQELVRIEYTTEVDQIYQQLDCFVLPSHQEGLSIALLEAMSYGLPVIVTADGEHPVIQSDRNGLVCQPGSLDGLVEALDRLICDRHLCERLGRQAEQDLRRDYQLSEVAGRYLSLYIFCLIFWSLQLY